MRTLIFLLLLTSLETAAQRRPGSRSNGVPGSDLDILNAAVASFDGTLRVLNKKRIVLEMSEDQTLTMEVNKKTLFFRGAKAISSREVGEAVIVTVEARKVANQLVAVSVRVKDPQPDRIH